MFHPFEDINLPHVNDKPHPDPFGMINQLKHCLGTVSEVFEGDNTPLWL